MKTYTYIPTGDVFQTKSVKGIVTYLRKNSRFFVDETDKEYMKGYSNRASLLGQSIRFDKEANFIDDLMKLGQIKEGNVLPKGKKVKSVGIGGRKTIDRKVERIKENREFFRKLDEREKTTKIPVKKQIEYRLLQMERREKRRNEGEIPKNYTEMVERQFPNLKKKIGSTDSVISLSKIQEFAESIRRVERDSFKRQRKIQKFIEANTPLVNAEDLKDGATIWVFSGAPQYYISRAKLQYQSSSKSPNFTTLYLTDDNKYEDWRKQHGNDFDKISIPALRIGEGKYYKSVKKDKKIPLG